MPTPAVWYCVCTREKFAEPMEGKIEADRSDPPSESPFRSSVAKRLRAKGQQLHSRHGRLEQ
eukprot:1495026-Rhodomonas_salina.4